LWEDSLAILALVFALLSSPAAPVWLFLPQAGVPSPSVLAPSGYAALEAAAEERFAERSYAQARELYERCAALALPAEQRRWVDFRLLDTAWRAAAAAPTADSTDLDRARAGLEAIVLDTAAPPDRIRAAANESLGDFWWTRQRSRNLSAALPYYTAALDFWAGSSELETARRRYLQIVWRMAEAARPGYGYEAGQVPLAILENALSISESPADRSHAHALLAARLRSDGTPESAERIPEEYEAALAGGRTVPWYDTALFEYAQWLEESGPVVVLPTGDTTRRPDYEKALTLYRRLLSEYAEGESRWRREAMAAIERITAASLSVSVSNVFLPGSEVDFQLEWRNAGPIELSITRVDLPQDIRLGPTWNPLNWKESLPLGDRAPLRHWTRTPDTAPHQRGSARVVVDEKLPVGAYVLDARSAGVSARELILVSDLAIVVKSGTDRTLLYVTDALSGAPAAAAHILLAQHHGGLNDAVTEQRADTGPDGTASFPAPQRWSELVAFVRSGERQAFSGGWSSGSGERLRQSWKVYAFSDRPAYRPGETVHWKYVARRQDASGYHLPTTTLRYEVFDARGAKVASGAPQLNGFGSAWSDLSLTDSMPLGEYRVVFHEGSREIGSATLFRLEEYKLPEFQVSVITPVENGRKKSFRLGDTVDVVVDASYFFGGPVTSADVEIVVHQRPLVHFWHPRTEYSWLGSIVAPPDYGEGQIVKRVTTHTDAEGRARVSFTTTRSSGDQRYRIEARVTDASRREIRGEGEVRVTRQRYEVHATARHSIHRPGEKAVIDFKAIDANDQPVRAAGRVTVTRDHWYEVWLDPDNREIRGADLERARARIGVFPPPPDSSNRRWRVKSRGYTHEDVLSTSVETDKDGNAEFSFTPAREGFYRISWVGDDAHPEATAPPERARDRIQADTAIWVASGTTADLGYRHDGVEILVDRDAVREGETAPVMIVTPASGRDVLFTVEGQRIEDFRVVHLDGTVKLIEVPIGKGFVPNTTFAALSVYDLQLSVDEKKIAVPPVRQFLDVEIQEDRSELRPRDESRITITTRDHDGHPIAAEVGVGLVDESIFSIQRPYAPDPRPFFYGEEKAHTVQTSSSFQQRAYVRLVRDADGKVVDERNRSVIEEKEMDQMDASGETRMSAKAEGGVVGGMNAAPPPPPPPPPSMRAEGITVDALAPQLQTAPPAGAVEVRSDFRSTAFWQPDVLTGPDGKATVVVRYPDSLTTWRATAQAITAETAVGVGEATSKTTKPLIVRLEGPRFLVVGDRAVISAVVNNNTDHKLLVTPTLEATGIDVAQRSAAAPHEVGPHAEAREDWTVSAAEAGSARLSVAVRAVGESLGDAMQREMPVYEHGIEKLLARSGRLRSAEAVTTLELPHARRPRSTTLVVEVAPSIATTMLDALPFLVDYPYGCTEQTMSRFLPAAIVARTLAQLGLDADEVAGRAFGGVETATAAATHPRGAHLERMNDAVRKGIGRLADFQHADGGWGWWKKGDSDPFMTAYVVWGFAVARDGGLDVRTADVSRAAAWLDKRLVESEADISAQAWMLHALAAWRGKNRSGLETKAFANVWESRDRLSAYSRALLALAAERFGDHESALVLVRNLEDGVKLDRTPDRSLVGGGARESAAETMATAHWGEDGFWWRWWDGPVESTAFALRAMMAIDPQNRLVEPAMNWLVKNRRGAQWNNTRDSAIAVLALNDYLVRSGELTGSGSFEISVNGSPVAARSYEAKDVLEAPSRFAVDAALLKDGANEVRIRRTSGSGPLYFSSEARFFSMEEPIPAAGHEIFVRRQYERLAGRPTLLKGYVYDGVRLADRGTIVSGQRIEVVVTIEAKNDYDYLMLEDLKPAGLEAVELTSGDDLVARELKSSEVGGRLVRPVAPALRRDDAFTGRSRPVHEELRDRKVGLFIDHLPQGVWEIRYALRAEVPGTFHALPVIGQAMYVPEIRANGDETRLEVSERP
jgi:uncharacterized protein YfaS (alpha-2-macroglobulin family)